MGLLLSIFVVCVGVIEVLSCFEHFQYGILRYATNFYETARRRNSMFLNYKPRNKVVKSKQESVISEANDVESRKSSPELNGAILDVLKSHELHLLQLQQQHLQLQLQIARLKETEEKDFSKKAQIPKKLGKEEKADLVKSLLTRTTKVTKRSISMPEQVLSKKDLEISKIINELASEPIDETDNLLDFTIDAEILTKEFDELFADEPERPSKESNRLVEKRSSLTEVAFITENAEGKIFPSLSEDNFASEMVEQKRLEDPLTKRQFEEASPCQEMFYSQKVVRRDSVPDVPHLDKSTSVDNVPLVTRSTSFDLNDVDSNDSTTLEKSTSTNFEDMIPLNKSTSIDFNDFISEEKSTSSECQDFISKSTSMDFSELFPINKSTSVDFGNAIPVSKSTSMDFSNFLMDSSTQMDALQKNYCADSEDFFSVSESEDEETICTELSKSEGGGRKDRKCNEKTKQDDDFVIIPSDSNSADVLNDDSGNVATNIRISSDENLLKKDSEPESVARSDDERDSSFSHKTTLKETEEKPADKEKNESSMKEAFWLIFSGEYTKAMSKDWHSGHFSCWQCDEALTGQRYVLRDDHPYCIKCYESVFANVCEECNKIIGIDSKDLSYKDKHWHEACFLCNKCRVSLVDKQFGSKADKIYCGNCYDAQFASRCDGCGEIFRAGTKKMEYKTRQWHEKCFCCCVCKTPIGTKSFIPREQEIYCATCYEEKFATRCVKCNKIITSGGVTYKNEPWHRECFTCTNCNTSLAGQRFTSRDEKPYCADCFGELFAKRCTACSRPITGIGGTRFISFEDRHWHNDCFICASCKTSLVGRGFITDGDDIICPECAKQKLM